MGRLGDMRLGDATKKVGAGIGVAVVVLVSIALWLNVPKLIQQGRYCGDFVEAYNDGNPTDAAKMFVSVEKLAGLRNPSIFGIVGPLSTEVTITASSIVEAANENPTPSGVDAQLVLAQFGELATKCGD